MTGGTHPLGGNAVLQKEVLSGIKQMLTSKVYEYQRDRFSTLCLDLLSCLLYPKLSATLTRKDKTNAAILLATRVYKALRHDKDYRESVRH